MRSAVLIFALLIMVLALAMPAFADLPDGGASISVVVDPNGDTTLDVKRGNLKVKSDGSENKVAAGETIRTQKGKPIKKLLAQPALSVPADNATVGVVDVGFAWQKVTGAAHYVLEVAPGPEFSGARTQTLEATRATLHLEPGTWYWRVVALDSGGTAGKRGAPRRLIIDTTPPKLKAGKPEWR
jgi:hypothetical protein